jgi:predicted metalloprotease
MKFQGRERSRNVEDRRGMSRGQRVGGGLGIGTLLIVVLVYFLGGDPSAVLQQAAQQQQTQAPTNYQPTEEEELLKELVDVTLKDTEDVWHKVFREQLNRQYVEPKLVVFSGSTRSACGHAQSATGPFYCPADSDVYIDLNFYQTLRDRFGASGDFAMAYVVAHEVGHHVQNLLGFTDYVHKQRGRVSQEKYNDLSVRLELQADFLAGIWAHHIQKMKGTIEEGDYEEAMRAAHVIGDDYIQKKSRGYVVPESFTHGTSEQRKRWFTKGYTSGWLDQGDTFNALNL